LHPPSPAASLGPYDRAFAYDNNADNRLVEADGGSSLWGAPSPSPSPCVGTFCYGADGVIASYQLGTQPATTFAYGSVPNAQIQAYKDGSRGSVPVTYDADGNQLTIGSTTYGYSSRNLLTSADSLTYGYDGFGIR